MSSFKNYVNELTISNKQKILRKKLTFCWILKTTEEKSRIRIRTSHGSGKLFYADWYSKNFLKVWWRYATLFGFLPLFTFVQYTTVQNNAGSHHTQFTVWWGLGRRTFLSGISGFSRDYITKLWAGWCNCGHTKNLSRVLLLCVAWAQFAACGWRSCRTTTSGFPLGRRTTTAGTL